MMGPYYYYDTTYVEDAPTELHIHDCMWSGECYSCQPARLTFSGAPLPPSSNGTVPITVGGTGYIALTTSYQETPKNPPRSDVKHVKFAESPSSPSESTSSESSSDVSQEPARKSSHRRLSRPEGIKRTAIHKGNYSSSDNKKLRHREVEKNRHRQLQAMVKTLSEKIPGRLDKETQVQTMKRAARYCTFLREVMNVISHDPSSMLKEKLDKVYLESCDNIELIMSQHNLTK